MVGLCRFGGGSVLRRHMGQFGTGLNIWTDYCSSVPRREPQGGYRGVGSPPAPDERQMALCQVTASCPVERMQLKAENPPSSGILRF